MTKKGADLTTFGQEKKGADLTKKGADLTNSLNFASDSLVQWFVKTFLHFTYIFTKSTLYTSILVCRQ